MMTLAAAPAATAATACKLSITACGCVMKKAKRFVLANDLTGSSATADCLSISKAGAVLDMNGHAITGPGGAATGAGIHVLSSGNGAVIEGTNSNGAKITQFGTGVLIDASDVVVANVELLSNAQFGLMINGGSRNALYDTDAGNSIDPSSGNGTAGVLIKDGVGNSIEDIHADHNGMYGVEISGGSNNALHDTDEDFDGIYGVWITGSNGNRIVDSTGRFNSQLGLYIGCAPTGGVGGACSGVATGSANVVDFGQYNSNTTAGIGVDSGDLANQIGLNQVTSNGSADAIDANTNCGTNLWFVNQFSTTPAQTCVK